MSGTDKPLSEGTVLIVLPVPEFTVKPRLDKLRAKYPKLTVNFMQGIGPKTVDAEQLKKNWQECTILCTLYCYPQTVEAVPNLRLIHASGSGFDYALSNPVFSDPNIRTTTSKGIAGPTIAEWFIGQLINHGRKFELFRQKQQEKQWDQANQALFQVRDLVGAKLGILGYGAIGRQAARIATALGMTVIVHTASPRKTPESKKDSAYIVPGTGDPDGVYPSEWFSGTDKPAIHNFLSQQLDVLLVSLPLTDSSRGMLGTEEFQILKESNKPRGCFLANASRGEVLKQDELIKALEDETLNGAALDVATPEPLPADSPLWTAPRCTVTPHCSSLSERYTLRVFDVLDANLEKAPGEKLINELEKKRGY